MAFNDIYRRHVELLVRTLPHIAEESCFALKGGTAINLFVRNMPRLSVDIDLTYLPLAGREQSLADIDAALKRIANRIQRGNGNVRVTEATPRSQSTVNKLVVRAQDRVQIKIEVTPVLRGCVYNPKLTPIVERAEDEFGYAEIKVSSFADLYAGKIVAALDRQHPRDLFDVCRLFENEGLTGELRVALIVYLISHDHSLHTLLNPALRDISRDFEQNFTGMTDADVTLDTLLDARTTLIEDVTGNMPEHHKHFLRSFYAGEPDWHLLEAKGIEALPAVRWRQMNLDRAGQETRDALLRNLEKVIG